MANPKTVAPKTGSPKTGTPKAAAAKPKRRWARSDAWLVFLVGFMAIAGAVWSASVALYGIAVDSTAWWRGFLTYPIVDAMLGLGVLTVLLAALVFRRVRWARLPALVVCLVWLAAIAWYASQFESLSLDAYRNVHRIYVLGLLVVIVSLAGLFLLLRRKADPVDGAAVLEAALDRGFIRMLLLGGVTLIAFLSAAMGMVDLAGDLNFDSELRHAGADPARGYSVEGLRRLIRSDPGRAWPYRLLSAYYEGQRNTLSYNLAIIVFSRRVAANALEHKLLEGVGSYGGAVDVAWELKFLVKRLQEMRAGVVALARHAGDAGRIRIVREFDPQVILSRPAATGQGVLNLDQFELLRLACDEPTACKEHFASGNLQAAAGEGVASIRGVGTCCALSLDDPDLRLFQPGTAETALKKSPELSEPVLAVLTRMLFKQFFLLNFIASASPGS